MGKMKNMKKAALLLAVVCAIGQTPTAVMAHGHGNGHSSSHHVESTAYSPCTVSGCTKNGTHRHKGVCYYGHYSPCTVDGCTKTGTHRHKGICYYGHS